MLSPKADLSAIAEQMCRIEHKLDLLIFYLAQQDGTFPLRLMSDKNLDPLTLTPVEYIMDLFKGHAVRRASDGTGLVPPNSVLFSPTTQGSSSNGSNEGSGDAG